MFLGLRSAIYYAPDVAAAKAWYVRALGVEPYFDEPFYVGFNVGGDIKVAVVEDPFGNASGIIENPHFEPGSVR